VDTIKELNGKKKTLREKLHKITELNGQIAELNRTISNLRQQIEEQQQQIKDLETNVANLEQDKRKLEEDNEGLKIAKNELKETIKELRGQIEVLKGSKGITIDNDGSIQMSRLKIKPGVKGTIEAVDQDHQFVVAKVSQKFIDELLSTTTKGTLPYVPLIVRRGKDTFVSKIMVKQLKEEDKLIIGDIMIDWQQGPIKVGDQVYYQ
jgi:predicted RNase H-like nuclease (RuvC/YqgF family)